MNRLRLALATVASASILTAVSMHSASAVSRNWQLASSGANGSKVYVDTATWTYVTDEPSQILFWEKTIGLNRRVGSRIVVQTISKLIIDCADDTFTYGPSTSYDRRGTVVQSFTTWDAKWSDIIPDSIAEAERDYVCSDWDSTS